MAGDWIKMRSNLHEDPRVIQLACELSTDELHVVGMLWRVWAWADQQFLNGNAITVTESYLDRLVHRDGFSVALRKVGWLGGRDRALHFPRFAEHNGQTAKSRAVTQKRVANHRSVQSVTPVTPTALPEKRREEQCVVVPKAEQQQHDEAEKDWKARMAKARPGVNIDAELKAAGEYVRKRRGAGATLTRVFFEREWLPGIGAAVAAVPAPAQKRLAMPEPDGWREAVQDSVYGPGEEHEAKTWSDLPIDVQRHLCDKLNERTA